MYNGSGVTALRYGHQPGRDDRMTTHVDLTARALGADWVILPNNAGHSMETVENITGRFGDPFEVEFTEASNGVIRNWERRVVHLTVYSEHVQDVEASTREAHAKEPLLVIVGGEKAPSEMYGGADWNIGVTNQPHLEVAGPAVFLDHPFNGCELNREWEDTESRVVPMATGKKAAPADEGQSERRRVRLQFSAARE